MAWKVPEFPFSKNLNNQFTFFYLLLFSRSHALFARCPLVRWKRFDSMVPPLFHAVLLHPCFWGYPCWYVSWQIQVRFAFVSFFLTVKNTNMVFLFPGPFCIFRAFTLVVTFCWVWRLYQTRCRKSKCLFKNMHLNTWDNLLYSAESFHFWDCSSLPWAQVELSLVCQHLVATNLFDRNRISNWNSSFPSSMSLSMLDRSFPHSSRPSFEKMFSALGPIPAFH